MSIGQIAGIIYFTFWSVFVFYLLTYVKFQLSSLFRLQDTRSFLESYLTLKRRNGRSFAYINFSANLLFGFIGFFILFGRIIELFYNLYYYILMFGVTVISLMAVESRLPLSADTREYIMSQRVPVISLFSLFFTRNGEKLKYRADVWKLIPIKELIGYYSLAILGLIFYQLFYIP